MVPTKVNVHYVQGHLFVGKSNSDHWVTIDTASQSGGEDGAADPVQYLVLACAGCSAIDITDFLKKSRKSIQSFALNVEADRFPEPPKILRRLTYHAVVESSDTTEELLVRAINLSLTKYCSVSLSLDRSVNFFARATLNGQEIPSWEVPRDPTLFERPWPE